MELPQVSKITALSNIVSTPSQFGGISSCDLDGLHGGSLNDYPCSPISDFHRKTTLEVPNAINGTLKYKSSIDELQISIS